MKLSSLAELLSGALPPADYSAQIASELAYTADVLELAERVSFSDPDVADDLGKCTDPEINGQMTVARALEIAGHGSAA